MSVAREIFDWCQKQKLDIWYGRGARHGGWVPVLPWKDVRHQLFEVWTGGEFEILFQRYAEKEPFKQESLRLELLERFNSIAGVDLPRDSIGRRPNVDMEIFVDRAARDSLLATFDWVIQKIRST